jgi:hypothetical protein
MVVLTVLLAVFIFTSVELVSSFAILADLIVNIHAVLVYVCIYMALFNSLLVFSASLLDGGAFLAAIMGAIIER